MWRTGHRRGGQGPRLRPARVRPCPAAGQCLRSRRLPSLDEKAAALLHSLARNHGLVDGNKRLALGALIACYGLNGRRLTVTNDAAYELVTAVASGNLDEIADIVTVLARATAADSP